MMKSKYLLLVFALGAVFLSGCGAEEKTAPASSAVSSGEVKEACCDLSTAKDGVWKGESSAHEKIGKSVVEITIKDHKITQVVHTGVDKMGNVKDEHYGEGKDETHVKRAQLALKAIKSYGAQLQERGELGKVDAISGATISYQQFNEAAKAAIEQAKQ